MAKTGRPGVIFRTVGTKAPDKFRPLQCQGLGPVVVGALGPIFLRLNLDDFFDPLDHGV